MEVGERQAWPFLTFAHPGHDPETRLYIDAEITVAPSPRLPNDLDSHLNVLVTLSGLNGATVASATIDQNNALILTFDDQPRTRLTVSGQPTEATTGEPWWLRRT
ncbi:hypothetical protein GCM10009546_26310 [Actinomadura livida]|uniref:Uncharacterized protein n=1 Tax=Actinomadura livida TaxID=79909 RepID=A0ABN1EB10_9ACTN|nr:hypothetical protein GCM10010208_37560 [Actinomadura livida]